jgi:hypothetical protein
MVSSGQDVAVENPSGIPRDRFGQQAPGGRDQSAGSIRGFPDNGGGDRSLHPSEFAIERRKRGDLIEVTLQKRRSGRLSKTTGDVGHDQDELTEQELSGVAGGMMKSTGIVRTAADLARR